MGAGCCLELVPLLNGFAIGTIPVVVAVSPGQDVGKGFDEEENGPANDGVVVESGEEVEDAHCVTYALGHGTNSGPDGETAARKVLTK